MPYGCASELAVSLKKIEPLLGPLRNLHIMNSDLLKSISLGNRSVKTITLIEEISDLVEQVKADKRRVAFTATSKILHMAVPELFVMADESIREAYGCEGNALGTETSC